MSEETVTLSVPEAGEMLGIGRSTAYRLAREKAGGIPVIRLGRKLRVPRVQLERMLSGERESEEERR